MQVSLCIFSKFPRVQRRAKVSSFGLCIPRGVLLLLLDASNCWHKGQGFSSSETVMDGGDSPVMTDSERRAYRYGQRASPRPSRQRGGMRQSWSNDSLAAAGYGASCVCAPTTHPGSFRCKHHRHAHAGSKAADDEAPAAGPDDAKKHDEKEACQETGPAADQAGKSSSS